jgi:hypothetical protein
VVSVEQLSEIINSKSAKVCASRESKHAINVDPPLKTGTPIDTNGTFGEDLTFISRFLNINYVIELI